MDCCIKRIGFVRLWIRMTPVLLLLVSIQMWGQNVKSPMLVTDLLKVKTIGNVSLSSNGSMVAYTITSIQPDEKNKEDYKYQTQIWIGESDSKDSHRPFTSPKEDAGQPAWSPDGSKLAFVRGVDGKPQIFIALMKGGEPYQLTFLETGASNPSWSPDGKRIVFTSGIPIQKLVQDSAYKTVNSLPLYSLEKPGLKNDFLKKNAAKPDADGSIEEVRAYLYKNELDKKAKVIDKLNFQQESTTSSDLSVNHVFLISPEAGSKPRMVTYGFLSFSNPQFIPNSASLLVESGVFPTEHPDRSLERGIYTLDTTGKNVQLWMADSGFVFSGATLSPSGKMVAYQKGKTSFASVPELYIMPLDQKKEPKLIKMDRNKGNLTWSSDEAFLYFTTPSNGGVWLQRYQLSDDKISVLSDPDKGISSFDVKNGVLAYSRNSVQNPSELYLSNAENKNIQQVTRVNDWVNTKQISLPEKHVFKNTLGQEVEYWVMKPLDFAPGKKYPLMLEIHGGPSAMWGPGESSMWHEYQYYCSKGYGIVYCNPRGSGGYGETFLRSNVNDWGKGPMTDILTALDKTVAEGWADTKKLVVTGGSYAGYMVAYILGHDQRFAAACSQRGVYDLRTFFGEGNAWRLVPNYFGGYPWEKATLDILERESPINYVQNIYTPLIIFHGEQDLRTGVIGGEQFYKSLKVLGRPVEYVRHPGATHEITRSGNNRQRIDQMLRTWEFFERFIGK